MTSTLRAMSRATAVAAGALAAGLVLTACGLGGGTEDTTGGTGTPTGGGAGEAGGEIAGSISFATLQLRPTFDDYIEGVIADFEEQYPDAEVEWIDVPFEGAQERFTTDARAGTLADVVNLNPNFAQPLVADGAFVDLEQAVPGLGERYVPGAYDAFAVPGEGARYGFPWYLTSEITMYNSDLFERAGLDPDDPPATFDELYDTAGTLAEAGDGEFYGIHPALENKLVTDLAKLGVPLLDEDQSEWTFNTPEAVAHVDRIAELYGGGVMPPDSLTEGHQQEIEAYQAGTIGLFPSGPNFLEIVGENAPDIAEATRVAPQVTGENGVANLAVMGLLVPTTSDNQATALAFAEFMTNAENQTAFSQIVTVFPSVTEALDDPYFTDTSDGTVEAQARAVSAEQIATAENLVPVQFDDRVRTVVLEQVQLAITGDITAQEALDQAVAEANAISFGG